MDPNGAFFFRINEKWAWSINNTLPERLRFILENKDHPQANQFPYDVAFPVESGKFSISWHTKQGEDRYDASSLGPQYARLVEFILENAHSRQHTSRTVFGPNSSYFTFSPRGPSWQHLPPDLMASIAEHVSRPTCVALGAHGSFVVLFEDGARRFEGLEYYPAVNKLVWQPKGITFISLNPHKGGMYFALYCDGSASWSLPNEWERAVNNVCSAISSPPSPSSPALHWSSPPAPPPLVFYSRPPSFHSSPPGFQSFPPVLQLPPPNVQLPPPSAPPGFRPSGLSMLEAADHIWSLYNHTQQHSAVSGLNNNFAASGSGSQQALIADPSGNLANNSSNALFADPGNSGFDPSSSANDLDPGILGSLIGALDPSSVFDGIATIFGN